MRVPGPRDLHLTYCLNIHAGEALEAVEASIRGPAATVHRLVAPSQPFGLGLRLGRQAVDHLVQPGQAARFGALLGELGLYAFTINGFPYGAFHGQSVKADVYRPDWRSDERLDYTRHLADCLATWLPEGLDGSISTVPVSYAAWMTEPSATAAAVARLAAAASHLADLERRSGREIHLGLEPEPDCLLEDTAGTVRFFEQALLPAGSAWLAAERGCTGPEAERLLRRHIGVCLDTCHISVQFETPLACAQTLTRHGIRISKVQLSSALEARTDAAASRQLAAFVDPVYLHQVKIRRPDGRVTALPDLTPAQLTAWSGAPAADPCRIHFHVPLDLPAAGDLAATSQDITAAFLDAAAASGCRHFEIETYTFDVLPADLRRRSVSDSIAAEYAWALSRLKADD